MARIVKRLFGLAVAGIRQTPWPVRMMALGMVATITFGVVLSANAPERVPPFLVLASNSYEESELMADESMMAIELDYQAGETLSDEPGSGSVYRLSLEGSPEVVLEQLGKTFGILGTAQESAYFDPRWPGYVLGPEDWSGPSLMLNWQGTGSWYYSNPAAYQDPVCDQVASEDGEEGFTYECENSAAGGKLPSAEEAKKSAAATFSATGFTVSPEDIHVLVNDEWGVGVSATVEVEGIPTAMEWSMFWAPGPVLASVAGHAAIPVKEGTFDTISPRDAVPRLASGMWWGAVAASYYAEDELSHEQEALEEFPEGEEGQFQPGEVIEVVVGDFEQTLVMMWDVNGAAWIVPGYILRFGEAVWDSAAVTSLEDGVIDIQAVTIEAGME